jgi:hypothetical protein
MSCPPEVAEVIGEILRTALLRIRSRGLNQDAAACALEADHVHNLPSLLANYSEELVRFYLDHERVHFAEKCGAVGYFEELWQRLEALLSRSTAAHD